VIQSKTHRIKPKWQGALPIPPAEKVRFVPLNLANEAGAGRLKPGQKHPPAPSWIGGLKMSNKKLRFGLPKGSLQDATIEKMAKAGFNISVSSRSYVTYVDDEELEIRLIRA